MISVIERLVILAGGISSRMKKNVSINAALEDNLKKDADEKPKAMIGLGNEGRPFLDYLIINAVEAGYSDLVIVIGQNDTVIPNYYENFSLPHSGIRLNLRFVVQPSSPVTGKPIGTADALLHALRARDDWRGKKFTMCNSDNLYSVEAFRSVKSTDLPNAMIEYNINGFKFPDNRVSGFSITYKDYAGRLLDIIEKPSAEDLRRCTGLDGFVGVSMNLFCFSYDMILPSLENCPLHPLRGEKEIPTAVKILLDKYPGSVATIPYSEHVPDLTSKQDIPEVKQYICERFFTY